MLLDWKVEWKTVMYTHLTVLQLSCSTLKCAYITVFHSTCQEIVLHWICSTEFPFDLPTQSVTYNYNNYAAIPLVILQLSCVHVNCCTNQRCNWVGSSGLSGYLDHFCLGQSGFHLDINMPDLDQKYLAIMHIKDCNKKIDTL